jgi:hypothetical protein
MPFDPNQPRDSRGQWTRLAGLLKDSGGFTFDPTTGKDATSGFAVSLPDYETKIKGHASSVQIAAYAKKHAAELADPAAHLGGWFNEEDQTTYLDVSHVLKSHEEAQKTAAKHNQLAYFDLGTFTEHRLDKGKTMSLSITTPTLNGEYDLSARDGQLAFWKQILPMKTIHYTDKSGARRVLNFDRQYLTDLATNTAVDQVGFLLADKDNAHTMDPERWRGQVSKFEVRDDGLYGKIVFPSVEAARAVLEGARRSIYRILAEDPADQPPID